MVETFSNMKALFKNDEYEVEVEPQWTNMVQSSNEEMSHNPANGSRVHLNHRPMALNKRHTLETSMRGQQISPLPSDRREDLSMRGSRKNLTKDTFDNGMNRLSHGQENERNSKVDPHNDHGDISSVQTFSDIVSK